MAKNCLVVVDIGGEGQFRHTFPDLQHDSCLSISIPKVGIDDDGDPISEQSAWLCDYLDREVVADYLTKHYPGKEVNVYKLAEVHFRPAGDKITKEVSESGVLPAW